MDDSKLNRRQMIAATGLVAVFGASATVARAEDVRDAGNAATFTFPPSGPPTFALTARADPIGVFSCYGEITDMAKGAGLVVITDQRGNQLVGDVAIDRYDDPSAGNFRFAWRDSIKLSNGQTYGNTGKFNNQRPANMVVISIIAILIGLLLPAVQKVR